jgi:hypothetical protein
VVNGTVHINDAVTDIARADLLTAYNFAKGLPSGTTVATTDLGAQTFGSGAGIIPPGTYTSGSSISIGTDITLDAMNDPNAVWVFQMPASTLITTTGNVHLLHSAQAKNVFWVVGTAATIGSGTIFYGTIMAGDDVTCATSATINGRILAGAAGVAGAITLDTCTVTVP